MPCNMLINWHIITASTFPGQGTYATRFFTFFFFFFHTSLLLVCCTLSVTGCGIGLCFRRDFFLFFCCTLSVTKSLGAFSANQTSFLVSSWFPLFYCHFSVTKSSSASFADRAYIQFAGSYLSLLLQAGFLPFPLTQLFSSLSSLVNILIK